MISLTELLNENIPSVNIFSESPMRISSWNPKQLTTMSNNYTFTIGLKEKAKYIGKFDNEYDLYRYNINNKIIDCLVSGDFTVCYCEYIITNNNYINMIRVWQDSLSFGLNRKFILEYYLKQYNGFIIDTINTNSGEKIIKKLIKQSIDNNYTIFVIYNNKERIPITNVEDIDKYYKNDTTGLKYQFVIER